MWKRNGIVYGELKELLCALLDRCVKYVEHILPFLKIGLFGHFTFMKMENETRFILSIT